jgi:hypothetical protein
MNQNDMDRYLWRTDQRWSADDRVKQSVRLKIDGRVIFLVCTSLIVTLTALVLLR